MEKKFSDEDEARLNELIEKAQKRYLGDADWKEVLEYLHDDDREEYEVLYKKSNVTKWLDIFPILR
tara:strand:+ start:309 stop:506 length:198 start_codon:yes stop_codon:yes gene_type:complete